MKQLLAAKVNVIDGDGMVVKQSLAAKVSDGWL